MRDSIIAAPGIACALLLALSGPAESRPKPPPPCEGGRFLVDGAPIVVGSAVAPIAALAIRSDGISIGESCPPVAPSVYKGTREGRPRKPATRVRARWRSCGDGPRGLRVRASIDDTCGVVRGVFLRKGLRGPGKRLAFTARLSTCGDGIVDGGGGESCDPAAAPSCDTLERCAQTDTGCACVPALRACVPPDPNGKPRQDPGVAVQRLLDGPRIPSVLAAAFLHSVRRYTQERPPASPAEVALFDRLAAMSPEGRDLVKCAVSNFESLSPAVRDAILDPFHPDGVSLERPVSADVWVPRFESEIAGRTAYLIGGDAECATTEKAGLARTVDYFCDPGTCSGPLPNVCVIENPDDARDVRTASYTPTLSYADRVTHEFEQECTVDLQGAVTCRNLNVPDRLLCPGESVLIDPTAPARTYGCLKVARLRAGDLVDLGGFNFFRGEAEVRLVPRFSATTRTAPAHVCGSAVPAGPSPDCALVQDFLSFRVPGDAVPGLYRLVVRVPNPDALGQPAEPYYDSREITIRIVPPVDTIFSIATEKLVCVKETYGGGSDEVGIELVSTAIGADGTIGQPLIRSFEASGLDTANPPESRDMPFQMFSGRNVGAVAIAIVGHEVDDRDAYREGVRDFDDAFARYLDSEWATLVGTAAPVVVTAFGGPQALGAAVGLGVNYAIGAIYAATTTPDLIIEDRIAVSEDELVHMTSPDFAPLRSDFRSPNDIRVTTFEILKSAGEYREARSHRSDDEESRYQIDVTYKRQ